ncbi:MAG: phosphoribosylglycinamide formyltransferase [Lachnospiraceae bacterium]|nr:phosphoribosylglycinamide formyltransferase [Lachnospiraceae bacterium]
MLNRKIRIAVFASGGGTNLQAILDAQEAGKIHSGEVCLVIVNRESAYAAERAKKAGIKTVIITKKKTGSQEAFEAAILKELEKEKIELIVLAGFMNVLSEAFIRHYEKRMLNIHPSLLPSFGGQGFYGLLVHEKALERGVKVTGATVHYVNELVDGGEIIMQKAVDVKDGDTPEELQLRVMHEAEWIIYPEAVEKVCAEMTAKEEQPCRKKE